MGINLDAKEAIDKATKFLEEYHSSITLESANLMGNTWVIIFDVGFLSVQLKEVKVDAENGKVLGYKDVQ